MADLKFQFALAQNDAFQSRVFAALANAALAVASETANEVQTITVTGSPTGGSFLLTNLPGVAVTATGTLTSASANVTGLPTTSNLFVGMAVSGVNVPANTTVATITSATAITLSANATGSGAQSLTFSGGGVVSLAWNATAATVQTVLSNALSIGAGNVVCTGGPFPATPIAVTFTGGLAATPLGLMAMGTNSLTGGSSPAAAVARTTAGVAFFNHGPRVNQAARVLYGTVDLLRYALAVAGNATVQGDFNASFAPTQSETTVATDIANAVSAVWNAFN